MGNQRLVRRAGLACACLTLVVSGCAEGMPGPAEYQSLAKTGTLPTSAPDAGSASPDGAAEPAPDAAAFDGEACMMGESTQCECDNGWAGGQKRCLFDAASPTNGAFGACEDCVAPAPVAGSGADAGTVGSGPGTTTPGTAGVGGGGAGSGAMRICDATQCAPKTGLFGLPGPARCCTVQGVCGGLGLLGCDVNL